jgi:outer membrane protein assembly factor BamB
MGDGRAPNDDSSTLIRDEVFMMRQLGGAFLSFFLLLAAEMARAELWVADNFGSQVLRFDQDTGAFLGTLVEPGSGGLDGATGLARNVDGRLWVSSQNSNAILRYDLDTGEFIDVFTSNEVEGVNLLGPSEIQFSASGEELLVGNFMGASVDRFDVATGEYLGPFTSGGPLAGVSNFEFGPDGNLYVSSFGGNEVLRYDGTTGLFVDVFASGNGLSGPSDLVFRGDYLYVSSLLGQQVLRFNAADGSFVDAFANPVPQGEMGEFLPFPSALLFTDARLLVGLTGQAGVAAFNAEDGMQLPFFAFGGGLQVPGQIMLMPALIPGDANRDGQVNLADFNILKTNFGNEGVSLPGDFNKDDAVSLEDFNILKANFGAVDGQAASVPEPSGLALGLLALAGLVLRHSKRLGCGPSGGALGICLPPNHLRVRRSCFANPNSEG